ncbi:MAG TPA: MFS transporter [Solirubrobacteraceae bacterium]|nr:MFS transporter [Solirubrobacteraceae bacterium]
MTDTTHRPHLRATLILACLAQFMVILDVSVVNVALPSIRNHLGFTEADLQWVVNAYTVTFAGFLLLGGRAADLLGRRIVFVSGLVLFAVASLIGGLADSQGVLIGARAVQGLGGAVIAPASLTILTTSFPEGAARNRALGIWGAMGGAGGAAGVLLGGILTDLLSWRWILFINVPIGLIAAAAAQHYIAEGRNPERARSFDLAGAVTATLGLSVLVLGIVRTDVKGWGSPEPLALMAIGVALLAIFLLIEGRFAKQPLMPLRIFSSRTLTAANVVVFLLGAAVFAMWFFLSLYLQQVRGYSPLRAGLAFLPMTLCIIVCSALASRAVTKVGPKPMLVFGMAVEAVGLLLFTDLSAHGTYLGDVLAPSLLVAIGLGCSFVPVTIAAVAGVPSREAGLASGVVNTSRLFGGALGLAVLAALATSRTNHDLRHLGGSVEALHHALTNGFQFAFLISALIAAAGAAVALFGLPKVRLTRSEEASATQPERARADEREPIAAGG